MTYLQLVTSIKAWAENYDTTFASEMDQLIQQAESRIITAVRLPAFSSLASIVIPTGVSTIAAPTDLVAVDSLTVIDDRPLLKKDPEFLVEAYQNYSAKPRFFAMQDDHTILIAPVPDQDYQATLRYFNYPQSIVSYKDGTYISNTFPAALLSACLWMASIFMKDWEGAAIHHQNFIESLGLAAKVTYGPVAKQRYERNNAAVDGNADLGKQ